MIRSLRTAAVLLLFTVIVGTGGLGQEADSTVVLPTSGTIDERPFFAARRHASIGYSGNGSDPVGELARQVDRGEVQLRFDPKNGYLSAILEALRIPVESQSIVFSKTSLQGHWIAPTNPRAIFYTDDISIAFVRNAPLLELTAVDPNQGLIFYALEQRPTGPPRIARSDSCLSCHESRKTLGVPGLLLLSVGVGNGGETLPEFGNFVSDHRSPFAERWGGWFVTGDTGRVRHMGNVRLSAAGAPLATARRMTTLQNEFDLAGYPTEHSDIAALMVLNHQARMTNLLMRVAWETRVALSQQQDNASLKGDVARLVAADARELVDYLLFVDEAPFAGELGSTSGFDKVFAKAGPRDRRGRSLRDLDLQKRLLRYPCSYMIYSKAFQALPAAAREAVYARLWAVLSGADRDRKYSRLSAGDRAAIVGILLETKDDLPSFFRPL
jgi:hypothetical protein